MCVFKSFSKIFNIISILFYIAALLLTLLNTVFSCLIPSQLETFKYIELIDYKKPINYSFLMNFTFGSEIIDGDDYDQ